MSNEQERSGGVLRAVLLVAVHRAATGFGDDEFRVYDGSEYGQATEDDRRARR